MKPGRWAVSRLALLMAVLSGCAVLFSISHWGEVFRIEVGQEEGRPDLRAQMLQLHPDRLHMGRKHGDCFVEIVLIFDLLLELL